MVVDQIETMLLIIPIDMKLYLQFTYFDTLLLLYMCIMLMVIFILILFLLEGNMKLILRKNTLDLTPLST